MAPPPSSFTLLTPVPGVTSQNKPQITSHCFQREDQAFRKRTVDRKHQMGEGGHWGFQLLIQLLTSAVKLESPTIHHSPRHNLQLHTHTRTRTIMGSFCPELPEEAVWMRRRRVPWSQGYLVGTWGFTIPTTCVTCGGALCKDRMVAPTFWGGQRVRGLHLPSTL